MQCVAHPSVETGLACSKCGKAICPRCLYHTPVGARCRECANLRRLPQYDISLQYLARGLGAALVVGLVLGFAWGWLVPNPALFLGLIVGFGLGYAIGESVGLATNRKVGPSLQVIAALGVILAYVIRTFVLASDLRHIGFVDIITDDIFGYIVVGLGIVIAIGRLR